MADDNASDLGQPDQFETLGVSSYKTSAGRSRNMAAIRRTDTAPELRVRSALHRRGHRYRKDMRLKLDGASPRPDIVFTRWKIAVFIDGCFWHACPEHSALPSRNTGYWGPKLDENVARDRRYDAALAAAGWLVIRAWEHEETAVTVMRIEVALAARATK